MLDILNQPYPSHDSVGRQWRTAAIIGLFVGLFLLLFQPFGMGPWQTPHKYLKLLGFGFITFGITAFMFIVWPRVFPRQFSDERWTVGREIALVTANILLIAIANRLYLEWLVQADGYTNRVSWMGMILITFLVGLFPTTGAVLLNYVQQLKKYTQSAAQFPAQPSSVQTAVSADEPSLPTSPDSLLTLIADNGKDTLTLPTANLLYIESSDNYCTVVYEKNNQLAKPLLRSSLSRLVEQIDQSSIVRCHRSFVVNLDRVVRVTGNAQGYKLHLAGSDLAVPVSRQYNDTLVAELKGL